MDYTQAKMYTGSATRIANKHFTSIAIYHFGSAEIGVLGVVGVIHTLVAAVLALAEYRRLSAPPQFS
jgi:hypothetical protein